MTSKNLTIVNFLIVFYFILLYLTYSYKVDHNLIQIIVELFTIPLLIAQIVFLVLGIKYLIEHKENFLLLISLLFLAVCSFFTLTNTF
jgi:hypothetical protein